MYSALHNPFGAPSLSLSGFDTTIRSAGGRPAVLDADWTGMCARKRALPRRLPSFRTGTRRTRASAPHLAVAGSQRGLPRRFSTLWYTALHT